MSEISTAVGVLIALLVIALIVIIFLVVIYLKGKKKPDLNQTIALSMCPRYTQGHSIFNEIDVKPTSNGRTVSTLIPKDVKQTEDIKENPKPLYLVSAPGRRIVIAKGDGISSYRNIVLYLPPRPEQLSRYIQESILGQALSNTLNYENIINTCNDKVEKIRETLSKATIASSETVNKMVLENLNDISESLMSVMKKSDDRKKMESGGYSSLVNPIGGGF